MVLSVVVVAVVVVVEAADERFLAEVLAKRDWGFALLGEKEGDCD